MAQILAYMCACVESEFAKPPVPDPVPPAFDGDPDGECPDWFNVSQEHVTYRYTREGQPDILRQFYGEYEYEGIPTYLVLETASGQSTSGEELSSSLWQLYACDAGTTYLVAQMTWLPEELETCQCEDGDVCGGESLVYDPPVALWWEAVPRGLEWTSGEICWFWTTLWNGCNLTEAEPEARDGVWRQVSQEAESLSFLDRTGDAVQVDIDCAGGGHCWSIWYVEDTGEVAHAAGSEDYDPEWVLTEITAE